MNKLKEYLVKKIRVDSQNKIYPNDNEWTEAILLNDFSQPWNKSIPQKTSFKALHSNQYLCLRYDVVDEDIHIYLNKEDKMDVIKSDRVEIFFRKNEEMNPYYCLEIDPHGRVLDYKASLYRKFDYQWTWPKGQINVKTNQSSIGYQIDIALSLMSLKDLGLIENGRIQAGIYRADCKSPPQGDGNDPIFQWITWVDPNTHKPDFHVPTSFGELRLE